ncbi:2,5-diketo-D-gluconate reductase A [Dysgonomonas alginatilytica]|uniref:2,5-diketo-D-gluconate reductase A n=1 Tax=Dysgonomonas alginatilytica TaxID=1605892 RepID=A0A2V3PMP1_9BACT|nr:aldo/keto reductase [Dysgonomonas alginatilytica]PXV63293.1 2,5-diketo-D-gluconate reductase A [Dysgonomonas alginatilytica]
MKKYLILCIFSILSISIYSQIGRSVPEQTLSNGVSMPILGFGTLYLTDSIGERCVAQAISVGYRLLDTGRIYGNEEAVGKGIKKSGIKREELFVTTKVWVSDMGYENTKKAFEESMNKLGLDYIDLYLIHRPRGDIKGTWKAMEELYEAGKIKAIGVSNFEPDQLTDLIAYAKIKPMVNQIETNVFFQQHEAQAANEKLGVQVEAWSPFAEGRNGFFSNQTLAAIGKKYNKSIAQVTLRWLIQRGIVAIPRTSSKEHMIENINIFDFELDASDMQQISKLDLNTSQFPEWE